MKTELDAQRHRTEQRRFPYPNTPLREPVRELENSIFDLVRKQFAK